MSISKLNARLQDAAKSGEASPSTLRKLKRALKAARDNSYKRLRAGRGY